MSRVPDAALDVAARNPDALGAGRWEGVCRIHDLTPDRGVAALVDGVPVAVFLLSGGELLAIDDLDPFSGASVLSRGIVGDVAGEPTVASPVYKQRFLLRTGRCIEDPSVSVVTWPVRVRGGRVEVAVP
ncbi:MAG: nitrite reductase small subunit NirD [Acidimicrobiales bacterium]|nr:nitrite reductase small subunit NirD [Acidimicrobiales bacterium]